MSAIRADTAHAMNTLRPLGLALALLLQVLALVLLSRETTVGWPLLLHLAGTVLWGVSASFLLPNAARSAAWLAGGCAAIFPVLGPLASLALAATLHQAPPKRATGRYVIWRDEPAATSSNSLPSSASGHSIVEILQSPQTQLRRNAILALRELDPQVAIPLLRKGLQDSDEQVRIYAQNILSAMIERFEAGLKEIEQRLDAEPMVALHSVRLAEHFHELVYLDVAGDDETAAHYLGRAQTLLQRAAGLAPADRQIPLLGLKCALRSCDLPAARRWFAQLEAGGSDVEDALPWRMEMEFMAGNWPRLQELFTVFQRARLTNPRIEELIRFWQGSRREAP